MLYWTLSSLCTINHVWTWLRNLWQVISICMRFECFGSRCIHFTALGRRSMFSNQVKSSRASTLFTLHQRASCPNDLHLQACRAGDMQASAIESYSECNVTSWEVVACFCVWVSSNSSTSEVFVQKLADCCELQSTTCSRSVSVRKLLIISS